MRKRVQIALTVLLTMAAVVSAWLGLRQREPVYHGRRLSDWLTAYRLHGLAGVETWQVRVEQQEADEAVRHVGTNALPTLLRMLRAQDSALKVRFIGLAARQHLIQVNYIPAEEMHYRACWAFGVLRAKAWSAVPALIEIAKLNLSRDSQYCALAALANIGPPAKEAIPFLLERATNADGNVGVCARNALTAIDPEAATKVGEK
jgi:hypothetical protein